MSSNAGTLITYVSIVTTSASWLVAEKSFFSDRFCIAVPPWFIHMTSLHNLIQVTFVQLNLPFQMRVISRPTFTSIRSPLLSEQSRRAADRFGVAMASVIPEQRAAVRRTGGGAWAV